MKTTIKDKQTKGKIPREIRAIANLIKTERKNQQLTLAALSEKIQGNTFLAKPISEIERGIRPHVEFITICNICKALGIEVI